jgi:hypothetical protein
MRHTNSNRISDGTSRSGSDLNNVEGPDAADHRGRGYRRCRRRANLLLYVRDNAGVGIRAAHDELVERRDDLFHRSRAASGAANAFPYATGMKVNGL